MHYFQGRSAEEWTSGVPLYAKVRYSEIYPGIDLSFYGNQRQVEYDFVVAPGGEPSRIRLTFEGAQELKVDDAGRLIASLGEDRVIQQKPFAYQAGGSLPEDGSTEPRRTIVDGRWTVLAPNVVGFEVGDYDRTRPLVIDPTIAYSTYLNGSMAATGYDIAVDEQGFMYVVGETSAPDFPVTAGAVQTVYGETVRNAFVAKLTPAGDQLVFATYLGGRQIDGAFGVALDPQGNIYVTGDARSNDFPVTPGAFDTEPTAARPLWPSFRPTARG